MSALMIVDCGSNVYPAGHLSAPEPFVHVRAAYARGTLSRAAAMLSILLTAVGSSAHPNESAATVT
jgi:hypothetical protein